MAEAIDRLDLLTEILAGFVAGGVLGAYWRYVFATRNETTADPDAES